MLECPWRVALSAVDTGQDERRCHDTGVVTLISFTEFDPMASFLTGKALIPHERKSRFEGMRAQRGREEMGQRGEEP